MWRMEGSVQVRLETGAGVGKAATAVGGRVGGVVWVSGWVGGWIGRTGFLVGCLDAEEMGLDPRETDAKEDEKEGDEGLDWDAERPDADGGHAWGVS